MILLLNTSYALFLALGLPLLAVELFGVWRRPGGHAGGEDTISEAWWSIRNRYPLLTVAMAGFLLWLMFHFLYDGWRRQPD